MADEQAISQLKERVAFLEVLVMSLVAKNVPSANPVATPANTNPATNVQPAPASSDRTFGGESSHFMRLPPELRADILKRVLQPTFAAAPYGLVPSLSLPVTIYTSKTKFPAALQINQTMRTEGVRLYLGLARNKLADLEIENKKLYEKHEALVKEENDSNGLYVNGWAPVTEMLALRDKIISNFTAMIEVDSSCKALQGAYKRKQALPQRWQYSNWD